MENRDTLNPSTGDAILKRHLFSGVAKNWIKDRGDVGRAYFVRRPSRQSFGFRVAASSGPILKAPGSAGGYLLFVGLAHDRRFVGAVLLFVLFVFVLVLFVFIRISGRHRVAHDHEGTPVAQPGGKFLGDVWGHVVAPRVWTLGDFTPSAVIRPANLTPLAGGSVDRSD